MNCRPADSRHKTFSMMPVRVETISFFECNGRILKPDAVTPPKLLGLRLKGRCENRTQKFFDSPHETQQSVAVD